MRLACCGTVAVNRMLLRALSQMRILLTAVVAVVVGWSSFCCQTAPVKKKLNDTLRVGPVVVSVDIAAAAAAIFIAVV